MTRRYRSGAIRALPSGRYQAQARYQGRLVPAPTTFDTRGDAEAWLARAAKSIATGTWTPPAPKAVKAAAPPVLTVAVYADQWLAERDLKPRTRADYRILLDRWILPALGSVPVTDVTPAMVRSWHADLAPGRETTRARAYGLLRTIMGTAVSDDLNAANPCRIRGAGSVRRRSTTTIATVPEVEAIAAAMPDRYRAMIWLAAWCGLRYGEVTELRRGDLDLDAQVVRVRRGVVKVRGSRVVDTPKSNAGIRDVAIPPHVVPLLDDHLRDHTAADSDALLFPSDQGSHLPTTTFYGWYYPARESAGRPDLRFHDLRHTQATLAAATGATLSELMGRIGHSTPGAAMRYQHVAADRDRAIADALSGLAGADVVPLRPRGRKRPSAS